ncbi:type III pantothenate kinase [Niabella ginsenosidivorans]|uniref:Type III pantothenate kinase n=1 Tax=Niabella ginsenosidivorans TaxID=1176587 RepID=A0A1A9I7H6_9BACT|nr:type III pantothenate kinase [Niabella ginsenosidivorans]ANH83285.1 type III pantothenate kinase [Niabella ginsenosidivorans]
MSSTLCFDFGNTRKKVAIFEGNEIVKTLVLQDDTSGTIRSLIDTYKPKKSILSSVIHHNPEIETILQDRTRFHLLSYRSKLPITTPVGKPETIGADRLAIAAGGVHFYPDKNLLLIGLGTCITTNFVNKYKELIGGSISPGLEMRLRSLQYYTAQLPLITPQPDVPLMGYDTETNILSGVILGMAYELDGFIAAYEEKFDNFNVVLTGGDLQHLASHLKSRIFADPELIFKGLYAISEVNNA